MIVAGNIALWLAFVLAGTFSFAYPTVARIRSEYGFHVWSFMAVIALILGLVLGAQAGWITGDARYVLRFAIYGLVAIQAAWRWSLLIRTQIKKRK